MSERADHQLCSFFSVQSGQLRPKVLPLAAGFDDSSRYGLGEVVSDHAARRCRAGGRPSIGVDQPPVLVEPRMSDPLHGVTDPGNLVSRHVATGCQIERHARSRRTAQVEQRARPRQIQPWRVVDPARTARVRFICPVAVCVEVLRARAGLARTPRGTHISRGPLPDRRTCTPVRCAPRRRSPGPGRRGDPGRCRPLL
jgi:hypothetical protein